MIIAELGADPELWFSEDKIENKLKWIMKEIKKDLKI